MLQSHVLSVTRRSISAPFRPPFRPPLRPLVWPGAVAVFTLALVVAASTVAARAQDAPSLRAGALAEHITIDGRLTEPAGQAAGVADNFHQTDPVEGAAPSARTRVQVLADAPSLVIGIVCDQPAPADIVSFSVRRDA